VKEAIYSTIRRTVKESGLSFYQEPLMGVAGVNNPILRRLKSLIHPNHLLPEDIQSGARSVVAYYLPFKERVVKENRGGHNTSRLWAEVYILTNQLLSNIAVEIRQLMSREGYRCAWEKPTHNFDPQLLVSYWSHKHVAFACGVGRFGRNHLLITEKGCAGRIASLVTDCPLEATVDDGERNPFHDCPENCSYCFKACPAGALGRDSLDKAACYRLCLENDRLYPDLGLCDVCGKCATGPCALL